MKKWIKISLLSVLGLIIVAGVLTWIEFGSIIQGALSAEKLDDGMYYMEYKGDEQYYPGGVTDTNYCVLKFTATDGRFYSDFYPRSFVIE